jgi:hypothetical protein
VRAGSSLFPIDSVPVEIIIRVGISRAPIVILVTLSFPVIVFVDGTVHLIVIVRSVVVVVSVVGPGAGHGAGPGAIASRRAERNVREAESGAGVLFRRQFSNECGNTLPLAKVAQKKQ